MKELNEDHILLVGNHLEKPPKKKIVLWIIKLLKFFTLDLFLCLTLLTVIEISDLFKIK